MPVLCEMEKTTHSGSGYWFLFKNQWDCIFYPIWLFHMLDCFPTRTIFPRSSLPSPDGRCLGRSGCKSGWFLLCGCLQLSFSRVTSQGSWVSPGICLYRSPPFPRSSSSWDVQTFTHHTQRHTIICCLLAFTGLGFFLPTTVTVYLMFVIGHIAKLQKNLRDFQKHLMALKCPWISYSRDILHQKELPQRNKSILDALEEIEKPNGEKLPRTDDIYLRV